MRGCVEGGGRRVDVVRGAASPAGFGRARDAGARARDAGARARILAPVRPSRPGSVVAQSWGALALVLSLVAAPAAGQDTLRLPALQSAAVELDPRAGQLGLREAATALRLANIAVARLPRLTVGGEALHQSEVPGLPLRLPGQEIPDPPRDRYSAVLDAEQLLYDGGLVDQRGAAERVALEVARAELGAVLHPLRFQVNEAFFSAFLLQERQAATATLMEDLEARLSQLRVGVGAGTALPGDTAAVLAALLRAAQSGDEIAAERRAALVVLGALTGRAVAESDVLALPDLSAEVERVRSMARQVPPAGERAVGERRAGDGRPVVPRARPEYRRFAAERERLDRERAVVEAGTRPRVVAFGQAAYGRPGYRQFTSDPHGYWLAGIRFRWMPWRWGETARELELLRLQQSVVDTEEEAFTERLHREVQDELQTIARLRTALETDDRIIALREQVERQARAQLDERSITAAEYVDILTDLQDARIARQRHRAELARAEAQYLTTLGIELR